jgi:hypothetical protein
MKDKIDIAVFICLFVALYVNLTSIPKKEYPREVRGALIRLETK